MTTDCGLEECFKTSLGKICESFPLSKGVKKDAAGQANSPEPEDDLFLRGCGGNLGPGASSARGWVWIVLGGTARWTEMIFLVQQQKNNGQPPCQFLKLGPPAALP